MIFKDFNIDGMIYQAGDDGFVYYNDVRVNSYDNGNGYHRISLNSKRFNIHRLICKAFHGDSKNGQTDVNHKNGIPSDNRPDNLEWCTRSENIKHSYNVLKRKISGVAASQKRGVDHWKTTPILQLDLQGNFIKEWGSLSEAAIGFNTKHFKISNALTGKTMTSLGFLWRYKNKDADYKSEVKDRRVPVICLNTNVKYESMSCAARDNKVCMSGVHEAVSSGRSIKGLFFKLL